MKMIQMLGLGASLFHATASASTASTIYAYGTGINGLPIYSTADGSIYVATSQDSLYSVSFTTTTSPSSFAATLTLSNGSIITGLDLYIVTTANAFKKIGLASTGAAPPGAVTTGFMLIGTDINYYTGTNFMSEFWARPSATSGKWEIFWNENGDSQDEAVPVTLKT